MPRACYATEAQIPKHLRSEYEKRGDKFILKIEGDHPSFVPRGMVDDLTRKLEAVKDIDPEEYQWLKKERLESSASLSKRIKTLQADLDRAAVRERFYHLGVKCGVNPAALEDFAERGANRFRVEKGELVAYDKNGKRIYGKTGHGLSPEEFAEQSKETASHLFENGNEAVTTVDQPKSNGASHVGPNPFAKESRNLYQQSLLVKHHPDQARQLAIEAGVKPTW